MKPFTIVAPQHAAVEHHRVGAAVEHHRVGAPVVLALKVSRQGPGYGGGMGYRLDGKGSLWRGSEDVMGPRVCRSPFCQRWDRRDSSAGDRAVLQSKREKIT